MEKVTEEEMIRAWGGPDRYFPELEQFLKRHYDADLTTLASDTGALIKVEYLFRPYQVVIENRELLRKCGEANRERVDRATED